MRSSPVLPLLVAMTATLAACANSTDSVERLNGIPFGGTTHANLAAMVANPNDLVVGRGQTKIDGTSAAAPIERVLTDRQKALLNPGRSATNGGAAGG